ncbi:Serine phosphatase RsbU, regulator of sigma subunit [Fulvivirga imtechensis AK7]|uniref:Serine phosphatase RsbU, regulator of sigma subunit n=1 Tax=Fulvivirga imtechensis AK7 TaxID=1237149 RepID=L8JL87_9BACT|nr:PP2C family protein-serine/threonine phosphatase [Fulvivirga imtechensis]ELR69580.1 Serine phosphatase RsbU, regulator of sigma subunit [Fulvivirga imtechensis AK7]
METLSLQNKYKLKELELNALLEITQAINNNLPEVSLYKIYEFTLRANLNIKRLALYVLDEYWECKVSYGTHMNCFETPIDPSFFESSSISTINNGRTDVFGEFDCVVPISHKSSVLAMVFVGDVEEEDDEMRKSSMRFIQALSNIIIVAIENKKLARKQLEQEALRKELEIASDVQQFLFPENLPYGMRLKIEASYLPHDRVGGDYYDYIPINKNQFLICIADVSGKGIPAALMMSNFQASLRTLVRQTPNLKEIVEELNYHVLENAKGEKFITSFAAIYDHQLKTLVYVNSGHNPPLLIKRNGHIELLEEGSTVLGAIHPLPFINEGFITDLDDFLLFCYTDGLTETESESGEEYGLDRLMQYFEKNSDKDLRRIHQDIIIELDGFKGRNGYKDDITILSCKIEP